MLQGYVINIPASILVEVLHPVAAFFVTRFKMPIAICLEEKKGLSSLVSFINGLSLRNGIAKTRENL